MKPCNIKFKDSTRPFCFMRDGKLVNGTYVIDASDDGTELISENWFDDEGNEVNPAEVEIVDCPDCSKSNAVYVCNLDELKGTVEKADLVCLKKISTDDPSFHGFILPSVINGTEVVIQMWDGKGNTLNSSDYDIVNCC